MNISFLAEKLTYSQICGTKWVCPIKTASSYLDEKVDYPMAARNVPYIIWISEAPVRERSTTKFPIHQLGCPNSDPGFLEDCKLFREILVIFAQIEICSLDDLSQIKKQKFYFWSFWSRHFTFKNRKFVHPNINSSDIVSCDSRTDSRKAKKKLFSFIFFVLGKCFHNTINLYEIIKCWERWARFFALFANRSVNTFEKTKAGGKSIRATIPISIKYKFRENLVSTDLNHLLKPIYLKC